MTFPLEILQTIVGFLQDDQDELARLCRVSRAFYCLAAPYLYSSPMFSTIHGFISFARHLTKDNARHVQYIELQSANNRWKKSIGPALQRVAALHPPVEVLDLERCKFTASDMIGVVRNLPQVRHVNMHFAYYVDDDMMRLIGQSWPNLTTLKISSTPITNDGLVALGQCKSLETLFIDRCLMINETGLLGLADKAKSLKRVVARACTDLVLQPHDEELMKKKIGLVLTDKDYAESGIDDMFDNIIL
ncbi:hypothetical protein J3Q64DRAFT_1851405 [Phycomyces blakesleeanus]|uniref:F-box domain-containing protein n=2 Tax=Phycomyces blakesleeanus TaxID=4837 RepID=A0A162NEP8_PHYB8|nr:hypothetical protein PHYBLDRAFT_149879 [Phycomyces blakesleeanus NRRL 1555(-)]OAD68874.1 hypothetical protein PHYBLDRAFT_149879 [Phycomyces blakesleeanus NRRL 1555(-)]|eukprot:XP_018286914.1 hypothetical protein PHYBLDRAFT_149879 [Phycomyces blakesleeanus NRRL 1555(-)]